MICNFLSHLNCCCLMRKNQLTNQILLLALILSLSPPLTPSLTLMAWWLMTRKKSYLFWWLTKKLRKLGQDVKTTMLIFFCYVVTWALLSIVYDMQQFNPSCPYFIFWLSVSYLTWEALPADYSRSSGPFFRLCYCKQAFDAVVTRWQCVFMQSSRCELVASGSQVIS